MQQESPDPGILARILEPIRSFVGTTRRDAAHTRQYRRERSRLNKQLNERPAGWVGYWSEAYGRVLAKTFERYPPFEQPVGEMLASTPRPFQEALDPVASAAEPTDRTGARLPWRWARSLTHDLLGVAGAVAGGMAAALVLSSIGVSLLGLPPFTVERSDIPPAPPPLPRIVPP